MFVISLEFVLFVIMDNIGRVLNMFRRVSRCLNVFGLVLNVFEVFTIYLLKNY